MLIRFLASGWEVFATSRQPEKLDEFLQPRLHVVGSNIALSSDRKKIVDTITKHSPAGLDCLVNNAGYGLSGALETLDEAQIRQQFEVNFFAPLLLTQALLPFLRLAKGKVINISSVLGFTGMPVQSLYVSSKFALEGLSESLYYELSPHGVQVALVEPGGFRTRFASNMDWASTPSTESTTPLYDKHIKGYQKFLKKVSTQGKGSDPGKVSKVVLKLANQKNIPLRTRVGNDSQLLYYLRRLLPQTVMAQLLKRVSLKILETH